MIEIINLKKEFNNSLIHEDISIKIPSGQMTAIIGRSGEGKSLLLKQIIGLIKPTSGKIIIDGTDITKLSYRKLEKFLEEVGYVFQSAALLDSLDIFKNIGISLLENGKSVKEIEPLVKQVLSSVDLSEEVLSKYPSELSGGMQKRVGLARTLITNPKIILYDEPTTGLDPITTKLIHELMSNMQKERKLTSVVISHDLDIFDYADNVVLVADGIVRFFGDAKNIWDSDNPYIYQFIRGLPDGPFKVDTSTR